MIEELLYWPIKNRNLLKLGRQIEEINKEILKLDGSLSIGVPNKHRANSLNQKIRDRLDKAKRLRPSSSFEKLVLKNHQDSLWGQSEYLKFFFIKSYSKEYGVREFINYSFYPESEWPDSEVKQPQSGAVSYLEDLLSNIDYHGITKREDLMWEVELYRMPNHYTHMEYKLGKELERIKKLVRQFNVDRGFIKPEQAEALKAFEQKRDLNRALQRFEHLFGPHLQGGYEKFALFCKDTAKDILNQNVELDEDTKALLIDINLSDETFSSYDPNTNLIELNKDRFYYYLDKKTGKIKFYAGDLYPTVWHENIHRLQKQLSRFMPTGLRQTDGELNLTSRVIEEGVGLISEDFFMDYMENNKRKFGLSNKDIERAKHEDSIYMAEKIIKFCHSMYHREVNIEGNSKKKVDYDVHKRLAEKSGNWALADPYYLGDEAFSDVFEESFYIFGSKYVEETLHELEDTETARLGNRRKAKNFIKRNQNIVLQGLMTGSWGWSTHKEFLLKHYWPKARKYCDK